MPNSKPRTLLAFDFGTKKIGVAVGQVITQSATPLVTLAIKNGQPDWSRIQTLITTWQAEALIVGLPLNLDGSEQPISEAARRFAARLEGRFHLPVHLVDERYTSKVARIETGNQAGLIDSYSAKLILESWLASSALE